MILYFTYNDQPSGVYWSQVTDVVAYLNTLGGPRVRLFALVSGRDFLTTRREIKRRLPDAIILPMWPKAKNWKRNLPTLAWVCRLMSPAGIIARGPFATWMALRMRDRGSVKRVCFDARGAYAAEWEEYRIIDDDALISQMRLLENEAVNRSDFRLAVSNALVDHWRERYQYTGDVHVVIPCTLGADHLVDRDRPSIKAADDPIVDIVYSGSMAGWQSFEMMAGLLIKAFDAGANIRMCFLGRLDRQQTTVFRKYPLQVNGMLLPSSEVHHVLSVADIGMLIREASITNRVASPTKFAEYLAAGLPVLISPNLGDLSDLVRREDLGFVVVDDLPALDRPSSEVRARMKKFAREHFTKEAHTLAYEQLLGSLIA